MGADVRTSLRRATARDAGSVAAGRKSVRPLHLVRRRADHGAEAAQGSLPHPDDLRHQNGAPDGEPPEDPERAVREELGDEAPFASNVDPSPSDEPDADTSEEPAPDMTEEPAEDLRDELLDIGMTPATYVGTDGIHPRSDLGTLNRAEVPAILLEAGNMHSADDIVRLREDQPELASALADAIEASLAE